MSCSSCSSKIEREMNLVEGVIKVSVNLMTKQMKIDVTKGKGQALATLSLPLLG